MRVLAGDIGGTSARLAIAEAAPDTAHGVRLIHHRRFASRDFPGLAPIVRAFLADVADRPSRACFGIACPVVDGTCTATNLPWRMDARSLAVEIGIPRVLLLNDLRAVGLGVPHLDASDIVPLQAGEPEEHGVVAIIGAGTGLGEAFLTWNGDGYVVQDSEGGHASFSARNDVEWGLARWLAGRFGHVSCERVVSGPGLVSIYEYLAASGCAREQASVRIEMESEDPAAVIGRHAIAGTDSLSSQALDLFVSTYGARAGDLALTVMATGGVYVAGGIAPRIMPRLLAGTFMTAFADKGRLADVLARIPVHVMVNPHVGLIGAATAALHL